MRSDAILRTQAITAIQQCCQVGCGTKQPIVDYIVHLERQIEEGAKMKNDIRPDLKAAKDVDDYYATRNDSAFQTAKISILAVILIALMVLGMTGCKTTPEKISAKAEAINEKINKEQARANKDIDEAQAVGEAAKEAIETIVDNLEESVDDVLDNAKDSAEAVKEK